MRHSVGHIFFLLPLLLLLRTVTAQNLVDQDIAYGITFHNRVMASNNAITSGPTRRTTIQRFWEDSDYRYFGFRATILSW
jgi:hypothetical protein